jgi:AcrR family transcriptional regulator
LRQAQAAATRARILEACVSLMGTGAELTYSGVATAAGVQERTVYRYFPTKTDLEAGLWAWIADHFTHIDFSPTTEDALVAAMRQSFFGFDAGSQLVTAILHSSQGLEVRRGQQTARRAMFEACVNNAVPEAPAEIRQQAAAALQVLYSAPAWELLRTFWAMDGAQAADVIELAIRSLLAGLRRSVGPVRRERAPPALPSHVSRCAIQQTSPSFLSHEEFP